MDKSYRELFFGESEEYLNQINGCLVELEKDPANAGALNEIFRLMHTLKGMAATMGFDAFSEFAHKIEDFFDDLRSGKQKVTPHIMDTVFSCIDAFGVMLDELRNEKPSEVNVAYYISNLKRATSQEPENTKGIYEEVDLEITFSKEEAVLGVRLKTEGFEIIKVVVTLVEECPMKEARAFLVVNQLKNLGQLLKTIPSEEGIRKGEFVRTFVAVLATKESMDTVKEKVLKVFEIESVHCEKITVRVPEIEPTSEAAGKTSYVKKIQSMRITVERLDKIMNFMGELSIAKSRLMQLLKTDDKGALEETVFIIDRLVSSLQDEILQTRLLPMSYILDTFPRIVRDLVRRSDKDIDLKIIGSEIELDRVVLDEIGDPLMHIVRNAIDHGMEDRNTRKAAGKNPKGKVTIKVSREKGHVIVEVADDGRGIDFAKIGKKAVEKGLLSEQETINLDEKSVLDIMTSPGFSTSAEVTDISGRGVGLDVVRTKLDALGGRLDFETELGKGTRFILTLPLTLAIIKAMLVAVGKEIFAIPLMSIRESVKIEHKGIKTIEGAEVIRVRDEIIPILRLDRELGITYSDKKEGRLSVVLVEGRIRSMGLIVDGIIGEQDIVVKPLGSMVRKIKGIAGATILGDGRVALILDVVNLR